MAIAIEHARRNPSARTAVLAPSARTRSASSAAGLMINAFAELEPGQMNSPAGRARLELAKAAVGRWPTWLKELDAIAGNAPTFHSGTVVVGGGRGDDAEDAAISGMLSALAEARAPHACISPSDVDGYDPEPALRASTAIHLPDEGGVSAIEVRSLLDRTADSLGVVRIDGAAKEIRPHDSSIEVTTRDGRVCTGCDVVVSTGAWSTPLLESVPELKGRLPEVHFGVGRALRLTPQPEQIPFTGVLRTPNHPSGGGFHLLNGLDCTYLGASNHTTAQPDVHDHDAMFDLTKAAAHLHRGLLTMDADPVLGYRPVSTDGSPLLGKTSVPGLWVATGSRRDGFTTAPIIAECLVDELADLAPRFPEYFRPERGDLNVMTHVV